MSNEIDVGRVMYDDQAGRNDHSVDTREYTLEGGPVKRVRLDEGGMWVRGFGVVQENTQCNIIECFRERRTKVKMPRIKELGKTKKGGLRSNDDAILRIKRGMITFLRGVIMEGHDDDMEEMMNGVGRLKLVECGGDIGLLMEKMKGMNLGGEGGNRRKLGLVWVEKGGEVWERMEDKARMITGVKEKKEVTNRNFVNTRIVDSSRRMGKRGRREMGGWLNMSKFRESEDQKSKENLCVVAKEHTVGNIPPSDNSGENGHPVQDQTVENDHPVEEREKGGVTYKGLYQGDDHPVDGDKVQLQEHPVGEGDDHPLDCDIKPRSAGQIENPVEKMCSPGKEHPVEHVQEIEIVRMDHPVDEDAATAHELRGAGQPSHGGDKDHGLAGGVTDTGPDQPRVGNSGPTLIEKTAEVKNVARKGPVKNLIDKYLVRVDMGAAMRTARNQQEGSQSKTIIHSKPRTSSGGGGGTVFKKKNILKKKKNTNFTPSKQKIFNFFEQQQEGGGEGDGVVFGSSQIPRSAAKLNRQKGQLHSGTTTHLQVELQARPGRQHGKKA